MGNNVFTILTQTTVISVHLVCSSKGSLGSNCKMIILRNKSHGKNIGVCIGIFTTALRKKKYIKILNFASLIVSPLTLL